jgi:hypothetical protein
VLGVVLGGLNIDAAHRTGPGAELATDALLQAVVVAVEDMPTPMPRRDRMGLLVIAFMVVRRPPINSRNISSPCSGSATLP